MPYAIELFLDEVTDGEVRRVWRQLAAATDVDYLLRNNVRPHVALVVFDLVKEGVSCWREKIGGNAPPLRLKPAGIGSFDGGVIFVRIEKEDGLTALHRECVDFCESIGATVSPYYTPERWEPHCTLAQSLPANVLMKGEQMALQELRACPWTVDAIGMVAFPPTTTIDEKKWANETERPRMLP